MSRCTASSFGASGPGRWCGRGRAALDRLARGPVLPVGEVPELDRVGRVGVGIDQVPGALDGGAVDVEGRQAVRHHVVGVRRDQQVGQQADVLDPSRVGTGDRRAAGRAGERHRGHALAQQHRPADPRARQVVVVAGGRRRDLAQLGVDQRAVVALVVVLEQHLPVRRHLVVVPGAQVQPLGRVRADDVVEGAEVRLERHRGAGGHVTEGVHEQPAAPPPQRQLHQPVRGRVERGVLPEAGGGAQRPVERVGPRVVRADQRPVRAAGAVREQLVAAVPAGVRERPRRRRPRSAQSSSTGTSPTVVARWRTPSARRSASRPTQVQEPANRFRRSHASTRGSVYAALGRVRAGPRGSRQRARSSGSSRPSGSGWGAVVVTAASDLAQPHVPDGVVGALAQHEVGPAGAWAARSRPGCAR